MGRSERESIAGKSTRSRGRLKEASTSKSPNGFANISTRKLVMKLLWSENLTRAERQKLPNMTKVEERKLPGITGAKGQGLPEVTKTARQGLLGSLVLEALSAIIKIRFIKPMLIIKFISYLCQR